MKEEEWEGKEGWRGGDKREMKNGGVGGVERERRVEGAGRKGRGQIEQEWEEGRRSG